MVIDFLTDLFNSGCSYSSVNSAKSALAAYVFISDGDPIQNNYHVTRFMRGIFNLRPSRPKYSFSWNVDTVLNFLRNWFPHDQLSLKELTLKAVTLVALISGQRAQTIHEMDLKNMRKSDDSCTFIITALIKQSKPGNQAAPIVIHKFHETSLCVFNILNHYIERTQSIRSSTKLWVGYSKPHNPIGRQTISRWLKTVLEMAGIDTKFSAHSTRMASTSKAAGCGVGMDTILRTAGWTNAKNFQKFYCRDTSEEDKSFSAGVLTIQ